ncbi:TolC family protein [Vibrio cortegadensis]|uniref:TolC family protein n=1 Tax=Vibrio cortegadensis TaxID=1328770 RepID=A0ABV4M597_9VIBR
MTSKQPLRLSMIALMVTSTIGCSTTSDQDFNAMATSRMEQTTNWNTVQHQASDAAFLTDLVSVPKLTLLVDEALNNSPSLQQTEIALKIAYAQNDVTGADRILSVNASFSGKKEEDQSETYTTDLTVSWELDLWQKIADSSDAALKDVGVAQANLQAARDLLAANIMRSYLDITLKQQLVDIEVKRLNVLENNQNLILERYRTGLGSLEELDNAKTSSASTNATLADYKEQLAKSERNLSLLLGQLSTDAEQSKWDIDHEFPDVLLPLASMPKQDLARRPDLQSSFLSIEAETLRTSAAYKALLPSISLSASLTDIAESPSESLLTSPLWSVLGQLSAPIFQGGKLKAQTEIAELTTAKSYWMYQETLLNAVNEVENGLGQEHALELQQQYIDQALDSAKRSFVSYEEKYRQGLVNIFDLLTVQQTTYDLEAQLSQIIYNRLINRIDLGLALGLGVQA